MAVGTTSGKFKKPVARIMDKVRKMWQKPPGGNMGPFGSAGGGNTGTTSPLGADSVVAQKKKPPRKGRPD